MNTNVIQSLFTICESARFPLRVHEDDTFARQVFLAEQTLDSTGLLDMSGTLLLPLELIEKLHERELVQMTDCDSMSVGSGVSKERSEGVNQRVAEINSELKAQADAIELEKDIRSLMGIQ